MAYWKDRVRAAGDHLGISPCTAALATALVFTVWSPYPYREISGGRELFLIQLAALGYGLWTVFVAQPVHMVFKRERFRVVHAVDVPSDLMDKVPAGIDALPVWGPTPLTLRRFKDRREESDATRVALQGISLSARPDLWQSYEAGRRDVLDAAKPVDRLKSRFAVKASEIDAVLARAGRQAGTTAYLPLVGRKSFWTVFVDPVTADVVAYMPLDSF